MPSASPAFHTSPGFTDELVRLYLARDLSPAPDAQAEEDERIEIVRWPLGQVGEAISQCHDAKSLVALLWLAASGRGAAAGLA